MIIILIFLFNCRFEDLLIFKNIMKNFQFMLFSVKKERNFLFINLIIDSFKIKFIIILTLLCYNKLHFSLDLKLNANLNLNFYLIRKNCIKKTPNQTKWHSFFVFFVQMIFNSIKSARITFFHFYLILY